MNARQEERADRHMRIAAAFRHGDTPTTLANRLGMKRELTRHDMVALGLWTVTPNSRGRRLRRSVYQRRTVRREIAAELALAVLQMEETLDVVVLYVNASLGTEVGQRIMAARSQIFHAKALAKQHGVMTP